MNQKQADDLRTIRDQLLALNDADAARFDIRHCDLCAWGLTTSGRWIDDAPRWVQGPDFQERLGLDADEAQYLFRPGLRGREDFMYLKPQGRAGIEEFAERVENVLQFHCNVEVEKLLELRDAFLAEAAADARPINMAWRHECALRTYDRLCNGPAGGYFFGSLEKEFGLEKTEANYLFSAYQWLAPRANIYEQNFGIEAAREFADRLENILQFRGL